jgi:hypothetical protein
MWKKIADWFRGKKRQSTSEPEPSNDPAPEPTVTEEDMTITRGLIIGTAAAEEPEPEVESGEYILLGERMDDHGTDVSDGATRSYANARMYWSWENENGDFWDLNGVENGPTPHDQSVVVGGVPSNWNIFTVTQMVQEQLAEEGLNHGIHIFTNQGQNSPATGSRGTANEPTLQVVTDQGTFNPTLTIGTYSDGPNTTYIDESGADVLRLAVAFLKFDLSVVTGTVTSATLTLPITSQPTGTFTITVNRLRMPRLVTDIAAAQVSGVVHGIANDVKRDDHLLMHPDVVWTPRYDHRFTIEADWLVTWVTGTGAIPYEPTYTFWPELGIKAFRFSSSNATSGHSEGATFLAWKKHFNLAGAGGYYYRYLVKIDDLAQANIRTEVKMPGHEGPFPDRTYSYRMYHRAPSESNPQRFAWSTYFFDHTSVTLESNPDAVAYQLGVAMAPDQIYSIEIYTKMNTWLGSPPVAQADGIVRIWIDGVLVLELLDRVIEGVVNPAQIGFAWRNHYMGGAGDLFAPESFHYEIAGDVFSTEYIGPPKQQTFAPSAYSLPAAGASTDIAQNSYLDSSVKPAALTDGQWTYACYRSWSGGAFVEDYSNGGAFVISGSGGHTNFQGENIGALVFDFDDGLFKRIDPQGGAYVGGVLMEDTEGSPDGFPWYEINGSSGVPAPSHVYYHAVGLPTLLGGGTKGSVIHVAGVAVTFSSRSRPAAHLWDANTGVWSRYSTNSLTLTWPTSNASTELDIKRQRIWYFRDQQHAVSQMMYLDLTDGEYKFSASHFSPSELAFTITFMYAGLIISNAMWAYDPDTNDWTELTYTGTLPGTVTGTAPYTDALDAKSNKWTFFPPTGYFYKVPIAGGTIIWRLRPPTDNPKTGTWQIDTINISPGLEGYEDSGGDGSTTSVNRSFYVPSIQRLGWMPSPLSSTAKLVQLYYPAT